jgi:hypothetical protein
LFSRKQAIALPVQLFVQNRLQFEEKNEMAPAPRRLRPETELLRVEELLDRADRIVGATVLLAKRLRGRRQKKIRTYKKQRNGSLGIDLDAIAAEFSGKHVLFQLRDDGQIAGTASWRVPGKAAEVAEPPDLVHGSIDGTVWDRAPASGLDLAAAFAEMGAFAEVRAENRLLAEEVRASRTAVERLQMKLATAKAERKEAIRARIRAESEVEQLGVQLTESEAVTWLLRLHIGEEEFAELTEEPEGA